MRKIMTKEVTMTKLKIARIGVSPEGQPTTEVLEPVEFLGNINLEKSQKRITKSHGQLTTIFSHEIYNQTYEIDVEDFIKVATLKEEKLAVLEETPEDENESDSELPPYDISSMYPTVMGIDNLGEELKENTGDENNGE